MENKSYNVDFQEEGIRTGKMADVYKKRIGKKKKKEEK